MSLPLLPAVLGEGRHVVGLAGFCDICLPVPSPVWAPLVWLVPDDSVPGTPPFFRQRRVGCFYLFSSHSLLPYPPPDASEGFRLCQEVSGGSCLPEPLFHRLVSVEESGARVGGRCLLPDLSTPSRGFSPWYPGKVLGCVRICSFCILH